MGMIWNTSIIGQSKGRRGSSWILSCRSNYVKLKNVEQLVFSEEPHQPPIALAQHIPQNDVLKAQPCDDRDVHGFHFSSLCPSVHHRLSPSITVHHRPSFPMIKTWKLTKNSTAVNDLVVAIQLFRHLTQRPRLTRSKQLPHEVTPKNPTSNKLTQDLPLGKPQRFKCSRTTWHQVFLMRQNRKRSCRWVSRKLWECSPNFRGFNSYNGRVNPTKWLTSHLGVLPLLRKMIHLFLDEIWCFMVQGNNYFWGGGGYLVYSVDPFSDTIAYVNQMKMKNNLDP